MIDRVSIESYKAKNRHRKKAKKKAVLNIKGKQKYLTAEEVAVMQAVEKGDNPIEVTKDLILESKEIDLITEKELHSKAKKKADALLKSLQTKFVLDVTMVAPKALGKMVELMDAKEPVYHNGLKVDDKAALSVQKDAAKTILNLAKPANEKDSGGGMLANAVININNEK